MEVFISAGIFLILIQGTLRIIEQPSTQFKKSAFNFQTAAMLDYWNSEQVNLTFSGNAVRKFQYPNQSF